MRGHWTHADQVTWRHVVSLYRSVCTASVSVNQHSSAYINTMDYKNKGDRPCWLYKRSVQSYKAVDLRGIHWSIYKLTISTVDWSKCLYNKEIKAFMTKLTQKFIKQAYQWEAGNTKFHDDVIKWKHFPRYWPFVRGIHRSPVDSPHKGQWRGALMFPLICVWTNSWINNREAGDLRRYRAHYDVMVMFCHTPMAFTSMD